MRLHLKLSILAAVAAAVTMPPPEKKQRTHAHQQPNPPVFPESVVVFAPDDRNITETMAARSEVLNDRARGHFSSERLAFLFRPGRYDVEAKIGYYTSVSGLGASPDDVVFAGARGLYVDAMDPQQAGSLDTFWRSGDNFRHEASTGFRWAVSQAAPLRRIHAARDLELFDPTAQVNYASGGYLGNSIVEGNLVLGSQQQWISRNVQMNGATGGAWSNVYVGCAGGVPEPSAAGAEPRVSVVDQAPVVAAKPYLMIDEATGKYSLRVPLVAKDVVGAALDAPFREIPFEGVFVADASRHGAREINEALRAGLDVVLAPGIFQLDDSIRMARPGAVVMGLGFSTLVAPASGAPCVIAHDTGGMRLASVVLQASEVPAEVKSLLLRWGGDGSESDPSVLSDVFCRVGGPGSLKVRASVMVHVAASHVILDNLWLWRADHAELASGEQPRPGEQYHLVVPGECAVKNGLVVDGDDVTAYGLAVEHTDQDQVVWRGERGRTYFYQCELPYDVNQTMFGDQGYTGYRVDAAVKKHKGEALGIYSFFRDYPCLVQAAIVAPDTATFMNAFTKKLRGHDGILSVERYETAAWRASDPRFQKNY
mmetsp:Transcript_10211/g.27114  ORF Transcript_10211/g.27114 Transcript_10211/m.27114 type:complete len:596 (+) Transcript_10211:167-1954(+)